MDHEYLNILYEKWCGERPYSIEAIAGAGSNRRYYRLSGRQNTVVATVGTDLAENKAFVTLARHFFTKGLPTPEVLAVADNGMAYLQEDLGSKSLFDMISHGRESGEFSDEEIRLLEDAVSVLPEIQYVGGKDLDFSVCFPQSQMDARMIDWDLNYFKYCFLKASGMNFSEPMLQTEFDRLSCRLLHGSANWKTFMVRDFQSRNIMIDAAGRLSVIDFQGGRRGPGAYDLASFLWQAKAAIPMALKEHLIDVYLRSAMRFDSTLDADGFRNELNHFVLFRTLQVLGAYGFRGWMERKSHFLGSIPFAIKNLYEIMVDRGLDKEYPYLAELSRSLFDSFVVTMEQKYKSGGRDSESGIGTLTVRVCSFSFKKGIPDDPSGNGGGFVFDCRATHNPGRYDQYKKLTGMDLPVVRFLETDGEILQFIEHAKALVDASVERYLERGFSSLCVNFGCTGGQHRSVYSAETMARHLNEKYGVRVLLCHREQGVNREFPAILK